jgi:hypothetical protein
MSDTDTDTPKHAGGRPLLFGSVEELKTKIDAYFDQCDPHMEEVTEWVPARSKDGKLLKDENGLSYLVEVTHKVMTAQVPYTVTGLALALNTSRETLINYESREEFFDTIKEAKDRVEHFLEQNLNTTSPTGTIFNLKNNYGWRDKSEHELTGKDGGAIETKNVEVMDVGGSDASKKKG